LNTAKIDGVRHSCKVAAEVMKIASGAVAEGVTTADVADVVAKEIARLGGRSAFLGYHGFPGVLCISLNDEILHGIPSAKRRLAKGDLVKLDLGVVVDGYYSDMATTILIDDGSEMSKKKRLLMDATLSALMLSITPAVKAGSPILMISDMIQKHLASRGYKPVDGMTGHGVGMRLHEYPIVPNEVPVGLKDFSGKEKLEAGMTIAIEPMAGMGGPKVNLKQDGWTLTMADRMPSAHFEHTVLVTDGDPEILTRLS
jgi:methionyl aminopeptidase